MGNTIRVGNTDFNRNFFLSYMKNIFGESFAHSSLSFEKVFEESKKYTEALKDFASEENSAFALMLDSLMTEETLSLLNQRFSEVCQVLACYGVPSERFYDEENQPLPCIDDFAPFIQGAIRPYRNKREYEVAFMEGRTTGAAYESETLMERATTLYEIITNKLRADKEASQLKHGNNEAFLFAIGSGPITIPNIIKINSLVNNGSGIHEGFKTSNNEIGGASFETCPKEMVSLRLQELLFKYNTEWALEIPTFDEKSNPQLKNDYLKAICEREAKFHIEFERIHPFEEGNGRTGRIILNKNLIDNELAPILITPEMHDFYIQCIAERDYKTLGNYIFLLSSVSLTEMMSAYRKAKGIKPDELGMKESGTVTPVKNIIKKK